MFKQYKLKKQLKALIAKAGELGLPQKDQDIAYEFIVYNETGLALDQVAVQLYEFEIKIDQACYDEVQHLSALLGMPDEYNYLKELVRND